MADADARRSWIARAIALVIGALVITAVVITIQSSTSTKELSWEQKLNQEVADIDINLNSATTEAPSFEFNLTQEPPHFSLILCKGDMDDARLQRDKWNVFFDKVAQQSPVSYRPEFTDEGIVGGKQQTRIMLFVDLRPGATSTDATDTARKIAALLREASPCK